MSKSVNSVTLLGHIGQPPESRELKSKTLLTTASLATNERKKIGDKWEDHTEWHSLVFYGRLAEIARDYLHKGSKVYICGHLRTSSWEDDTQTKRYRTNIVVEEVVLLDSHAAGQSTPPPEVYEAAI
jgi:single-strand DNA-binding protein